MFPIMLYDFLLSEIVAGIFRQILRGKLDFEQAQEDGIKGMDIY